MRILFLRDETTNGTFRIQPIQINPVLARDMTHMEVSTFNDHPDDGLILFKHKKLSTIVGHVDVGWHVINEMRLPKLSMIACGVSSRFVCW